MPKIPVVLTCPEMEHFIAEDEFFVKGGFDPQPDLVSSTSYWWSGSGGRLTSDLVSALG